MKQLGQILQSKIIPWTAWNGNPSRVLVARQRMNTSSLPEGVSLSSREIKGKRVIIKDRRDHANQRLHVAEWPNDNLHAIAVPKLACVVSGQADYLLEEYCVHCSEGTFILIPPRTAHQCRGPFLEDQKGTCGLLQAYAYSHGILCWLSSSRNAQHHNHTTENYLVNNMAAVHIFDLLMEEAAEAKKDFSSVCTNLLCAFFTIIAREISAGNYMHPGHRKQIESSNTHATSFINQLMEYIETNCRKPLKVEDAAVHFYMSRSQFSLRVRQESKSTFIELLTNCRIKRAKALLKETDWTATAIARNLGFHSSTYFQSLFRKRVGCTPFQYRSGEQSKIRRLNSKK